MSKKIEFRVPHPCHENWDRMLESERGRFCNACSKTVVDFSVMSDQEVLEYFSSRSGNICGRFAPEQLHRGIDLPGKQKTNTWNYGWNFFLATFMSASAMKAQSRYKENKVSISKPAVPTQQNVTMGIVAVQFLPEISLKVLNERDGAPVPFATVRILPTNKTFTADDTGNVFIHRSEFKKGSVVEITSIGFEKESASLDPDFVIGQNVSFFLKQRAHELEPVVLSCSPRSERLTGILGGAFSVRKVTIFESALDTLLTVFKEHSVKVFPNPVKQQQIVTVQFHLKKPGLHQINIVNTLGQVMHNELVNIQMKYQVMQIQIGTRFLKGTYVLTVMNSNGQVLETKKILVL